MTSPAVVALVVTLVVSGVAGALPTPTPTSTARRLPPPSGCADGTRPPVQQGLEPNQLGAIYGFTPLWRAGHRGEHVRMALLQPGQSLDRAEVAAYTACWGAAIAPTEHAIGGAVPPPGTEAQLDVQIVSAMAPGLERLDLFEAPAKAFGDFDEFAPLIEAALDPSQTGGKRVDIISLSYTRCEQIWPVADRQAVAAALRHAASLGVTVFTSNGDSGSTDCAAHPVLPGEPGTTYLPPSPTRAAHRG